MTAEVEGVVEPVVGGKEALRLLGSLCISAGIDWGCDLLVMVLERMLGHKIEGMAGA